MSGIVPIAKFARRPAQIPAGATRNRHMEVDRLIGQLDLTRRDDYGRLLSIHHAVLQEFKSQWRPEDRDDFRAMSRRLQNDLRVLGFPTANPESTPHSCLAAGNQVGIAYVIRGSRLGASVLRPRIPSQFSASYFDFVPTLSWVQFLAQLQSFSNSGGAQTGGAAVQGARITFDLFSRLLSQTAE